MPRKIVSRATLGTRAIGSPALTYTVNNVTAFNNNGQKRTLQNILSLDRFQGNVLIRLCAVFAIQDPVLGDNSSCLLSGKFFPVESHGTRVKRNQLK